MFHLRFGLSDHLKALLDFVFGSRRRVKKVRIFRAWFSQNEEVPGLGLRGGVESLHSLANVPKSWPLARLTIPLSAASKHLERLLEGHCMEVCVTNSNPDSQLHFVRKFAKDLVVVFALHLAETISSLFRHLLDHPSKVLYSVCSCLFSGSTPSTERCSTQPPGIDLASQWNYDVLLVGW